MDNVQVTPPANNIVPDQKQRLRWNKKNNLHPYEIPLLAISITVVTLILLSAIYIICFIQNSKPTLGLEMFTDPQSAQGKLGNYQFISDLKDLAGQILSAAIIVFPLLVFLVRGMQYAAVRASSVEITPNQYPEEFQLIVRIAQEYGLNRLPRVFVTLGNGVINAASSGYAFHRFIFINSDLFEVGGKDRHPEALAFVIGHEAGHIAAGHTSYWRMLLNTYAGFIPVLGKALSRAQEYSADNFAYSIIPNGAKSTMAVLANGKYLVNSVDFPAIVYRAVREDGFFIWLVNLNATHPMLTWRSYALEFRNIPGKIFFRPTGFPNLTQNQAGTEFFPNTPPQPNYSPITELPTNTAVNEINDAFEQPSKEEF